MLSSYGVFRFLKIRIQDCATNGSIWKWKYDLRIGRSVSKALCFRYSEAIFQLWIGGSIMDFFSLWIGGYGMHFNMDRFQTHFFGKFFDHSIWDYVVESGFWKTKIIGIRWRDTNTTKPLPSRWRNHRTTTKRKRLSSLCNEMKLLYAKKDK